MSIPVNCPVREMLINRGIYCPSPFNLLLGKTHFDPKHYFLTFITSLIIDMHETSLEYEKDPTNFPCHKIPSFHPRCPVFPSPVPLVPVTSNLPISYLTLYKIPIPKNLEIKSKKDSKSKGPLKAIRRLSKRRGNCRCPQPIPHKLYLALHNATVTDESATVRARSPMIT